MKQMLMSLTLLVFLLTGCVNESKDEKTTANSQVESKGNDPIDQVADSLKQGTNSAIDIAAQMAKELSAETQETAQSIKEQTEETAKNLHEESKKVVKQVGVEAKEALRKMAQQVSDELSTNPNAAENSAEVSNETSNTPVEPQALEVIKESVDPVIETTEENTSEAEPMLNKADLAKAETLYLKCAGCHGTKGERRALNNSDVIQGWPEVRTIEALVGYKDGSYGGAMKGVMKGQVANLTQEEIELLSLYILNFK